MDGLAKFLRKELGYDNSYSTDLVEKKVRALTEQIDTNILCHILMDYCRYRGYSELYDEVPADDASTDYMARMNDVATWCHDNNKTISHFLVDHGMKAHRKDDDERASGGLPVDRSLYKSELALIWETQSKHDARLTSDLFQRACDIIYHRRPLKSQKHLKGKCELETNKQVCARSHPLFEMYRTWIELRNLRAWHNGVPVEINEESLRDLYRIAEEREATKTAIANAIIKHLSFDVDKGSLRINKEKIPVMNTLSSINKIVDVGNDMVKLTDIWHCIHSEPDRLHRKNALIKHGYGAEESDVLSKVRLAASTSSYSHKALVKLLPYVNGTEERFDEYHAREAVYPKQAPSDKVELKTISNGKLRNPLVQSMVNEAIRTVKDYITAIGVQPDEIVVEMTRSLSRSPKQRKNDHKNNKDRKKENDMADNVLAAMNVPKTHNKRRRYLLWKEQGGVFDPNTKTQKSPAICIYSGSEISIEQAFDPTSTENEHTIPRSRLFMDGFHNLTLATQLENKAKGNMTAHEYMSGKTKEQRSAFLERVQKYYGNSRKGDMFTKQGNDLNDMLGENHLTMTGYIATQLKEKFCASFDKVIPSNGSVTSLIRGHLRVNDMFKTMVSKQRGEDQKDKRMDLRHHGMDALICSMVRPSYIQRLSTANALDDKQKTEGALTTINRELDDHVPLIMEAIERTIVVQPRERGPLFQRKNGTNGKSYGVRGQLHDQNPVRKYLLLVSSTELTISEKQIIIGESIQDAKKNKIPIDPIDVDATYKTVDLTKEHVKFLKRHGILHGKDAEIQKKALIKREKEMKKSGRDLHEEFAPLFRSKYVNGIAQEYRDNGKGLKGMFEDVRLAHMKSIRMIDANITEDGYLRRDGHYLKNCTNHRLMIKGGETTVEAMHQYVSKVMGRNRTSSVAGPTMTSDADIIIHLKSLILLGSDRNDLQTMISKKDDSFLKSLYWVSGIEADGRIKMYPHNMTSSDGNKDFMIRMSYQSLLREHKKLTILDQREIGMSWVGSFASRNKKKAKV